MGVTSLRNILGLSAVSSFLLLVAGCGGGSTPAPLVPGASLSVTSVVFGNQLVGSTSTSSTVTLTNSGNGALTIGTISITQSTPVNFLLATSSSPCGTSLAAGATCIIAINFAPQVTGAVTATLTITDNAASSPQTVALTGSGIVPIASLSATSLAFPNTLAMPAATSSPLAVTLTNTGLGQMTISNIAVTGSAFAISSTTCGSTLAAAASCVVSVTFAPTANVANSYTGTLAFTDTAAGSPQTVSLSGTGVIPVGSVAPSTLAFPNTGVGSSAVALSTTLTNTGQGLMTISSVVLGGVSPSDFAIASNSCGPTLAAGASCSVAITFTPAAANTYGATLTFTDTAATSPQVVTLSGTGVVSVASLSPTTLTCAPTQVNSKSAPVTTTLTNSGGLIMSNIAITLGGANPADFAISSTTCGSTLAANGGTCTISVTCNPLAANPLSSTPATYNASILIADNAAGSPQSVSLVGPVAPPTAAITTTSPITFPVQDINTTSPALIATLQNTASGTPLTVSSVTSSSTAFAATATSCATGVAAGATCNISVTFTPPSAGTFNGTITVNTNASNSPQTFTVTGTSAVPALSYSATTCTLNGDLNTASPPCSILLTSTGNGPVIFSGFAFVGGNSIVFNVASASTCSTTTPLQPGSSCTLALTVTAPAAGTTYTSTLYVADNALPSPQSIAVTGTGGTPVASISPATLNFGTNLTGSTETLTATLSNTGTGPLTISSLKLTGAGTFTLVAGSCSGILPAGSTCPITILFSPTTAVASSGTATVTDNANPATQSITMTGTGAAEPNSCKTLSTTSPSQPAPTPNYPGTAFTGHVLAGTTPVIGASVQLYAAGLTGNGSAPTALGAALTTDSNGAFSIPATFTCPYNTSVLYAVSRGGKPGATGVTNSGLVLAGVVGVCNKVTANSSVTLNEVTTAGTAWAMAPFLTAGGKIGSSSTNGAGIVLAAGTFANLINISAGSSPGLYFPSTGTAPIAKINQVANLLNACTASTGASSNGCTQLYTLTATAALTPSNTLDAVMNLVQNPANNIAALYTQSTVSSAFTPALSAAPSDWTLYVNYTGGGMSDPSAVSIDSTGKVWVGNYFAVASLFSNTGTPVFANGITGNNLYNTYGGAVDVNDINWITDEETVGGLNGDLGAITLLNSSGTSPATYSAGGLNFPLGLAFDTSGIAWVDNYGNSTVSLLQNNGTPVGNFVNYQAEFPVAITTDAKCNAYIANQSSNTITFYSADGTINGSYIVGNGPSGIAVDANANMWSANYYSNSVAQVTPSGTVVSGSNGYTGGGINHPQGVAVDGVGNIWVSNYRSNSNIGDALTELAGSSSTTPGAAISPATGFGTDAGLLESFGLAIDAGGSIWITSFGNNTLTQFVGMAAPVKTPLLGPVRVP